MTDRSEAASSPPPGSHEGEAGPRTPGRDQEARSGGGARRQSRRDPVAQAALSPLVTARWAGSIIYIIITSLPYFGVKLSCVCLMFTERKY